MNEIKSNHTSTKTNLLVHWFILLIFILPTASIAQSDSLQDGDTLQYERFIETVEHSIFEYYKETWSKERAYQVIDSLGFDSEEKPFVSDSILIERLLALDKTTPFAIEINDQLLKVVRYFINKRRKLTAIALGRSKLYFPMYEEYLAKYNMPLELKYLSVIESGLRPQVGSRAGAVGLWQFMYRTGRSRGLHTDSYVDERMHPEKSTNAACQYLSQLYGLYGDWSMALAAYNAGPGNINKAIRRSGGKMTYWGIRPFLPKETQLYVPNFISMLYMMTYYPEHNITPKEPKIYFHDFETDTVCLSQMLNISYFDSILGINEAEFRALNPVYKTEIIPETNPKQCITLPNEKIKLFIDFEDSLYGYKTYLDTNNMRTVFLEKKKYHYVKPEETLGSIGLKHDVTITQIKTWNGLKRSKIYPGQKLKILKKEKQLVPSSSTIKSTGKSTKGTHKTNGSKSVHTYNSGKYKYYTLKSGESLWTVSKKTGTPFVRLQELNKGLNPKKLQPGDKIKIAVL